MSRACYGLCDKINMGICMNACQKTKSEISALLKISHRHEEHNDPSKVIKPYDHKPVINFTSKNEDEFKIQFTL